MSLILASTSPIRRQMLESAGVAIQCEAPAVDEAKFKEGSPATVAARLADAKALAVSARHPDAWVIGSDSVVSVDGTSFDKPRDRDEGAAHLRLFSGRSLILTSAVTMARGGTVDWSITDTAELVVRTLSDSFIETYLDAEWPAVSYCVGVFRMEGRGVQLFERIEGDHFTILGMPLLPLLATLRQRSLIAA